MCEHDVVSMLLSAHIPIRSVTQNKLPSHGISGWPGVTSDTRSNSSSALLKSRPSSRAKIQPTQQCLAVVVWPLCQLRTAPGRGQLFRTRPHLIVYFRFHDVKWFACPRCRDRLRIDIDPVKLLISRLYGTLQCNFDTWLVYFIDITYLHVWS